MQVPRLTTPNLHPKEQKRSLGTPEKRLGPLSLGMTAAFFVAREGEPGDEGEFLVSHPSRKGRGMDGARGH